MSADIREDLDLSILEDSFNAPHCELNHIPGTCVCTHTPVARKVIDCTGKEFLACMGAVLAWPLKLTLNRKCKGCKRLQRECWSYVAL